MAKNYSSSTNGNTFWELHCIPNITEFGNLVLERPILAPSCEPYSVFQYVREGVLVRIADGKH